VQLRTSLVLALVLLRSSMLVLELVHKSLVLSRSVLELVHKSLVLALAPAR